MATYYPATTWPTPFINKNTGELLANGTISAYFANTITPTDMFVNVLGTSAGATITLDAGGYPSVGGNIVTIWLDTSVNYKFVLKTDGGTEEWTVDNISGLPESSATVSEADDVLPLLVSPSVPVGTLIWIISPYGFYYEKKQGVATHDGIRFITENEGTTTSNQYYAELTGGPALLPGYASDGDFYLDTGVSGSAYVLALQPGRIPLTALRNGARLRFDAANDSTGGPTTVDVSNLLAQSPGTTVLPVRLKGGGEIESGYISGATELIYDASENTMRLVNWEYLPDVFQITAEVQSDDLVVSLLPCRVYFPEPQGTQYESVIAEEISITIPGIATLGLDTGISERVAVLVIDDGGTIGLAVTAMKGKVEFNESDEISTQTISNTSNQTEVIYSVSAATSVRYRAAGYFDVVKSVATAWDTPSIVQPAGGNDMVGYIPPGKLWPVYPGSNAVDINPLGGSFYSEANTSWTTVLSYRLYNPGYFPTTTWVGVSNNNGGSRASARILLNGQVVYEISGIVEEFDDNPPYATINYTITAGPYSSLIEVQIRRTGGPNNRRARFFGHVGTTGGIDPLVFEV